MSVIGCSSPRAPRHCVIQDSFTGSTDGKQTAKNLHLFECLPQFGDQALAFQEMLFDGSNVARTAGESPDISAGIDQRFDCEIKIVCDCLVSQTNLGAGSESMAQHWKDGYLAPYSGSFPPEAI